MSPETFVERLMVATGVLAVVLTVLLIAKSVAPPRIRLPIDRALIRFTDSMIGILDGTTRGLAVVVVFGMIGMLLVSILIVVFGIVPR